MAKYLFQQKLEEILEKLNNAFTIASGKSHIDDSKYQLTIEGSQKRILKILLSFSVVLFSIIFFLLWIILSYQNNSSSTPIYTTGKFERVWGTLSRNRFHGSKSCLFTLFNVENFKHQMVTQNLYVVYQDGYIEEYGKDLEMEISLLSFYT